MYRHESETVEFKLRIDRQRKIARTLAAFANGQGGTLVVGVRDNGAVAGCRAEEEAYMVEGAAHRFTQPEVVFDVRAERWDGKEVLVVRIPPSERVPHTACEEEEDRWTVYVRRGAANFRANRVLIEELKLRHHGAPRATVDHLALLGFITASDDWTASKLARTAGQPIRTVEDGLAVLLHWNLIQALPAEKGWIYRLA